MLRILLVTSIAPISGSVVHQDAPRHHRFDTDEVSEASLLVRIPYLSTGDARARLLALGKTSECRGVESHDDERRQNARYQSEDGEFRYCNPFWYRCSIFAARPDRRVL